MVDQARRRRFTAILRTKGERKPIIHLAFNAVASLAFCGIGVGLLWLGLHPNGSGRPPAWNVFAGSIALAAAVPASLILLLMTLTEAGVIPALFAIRTRHGNQIGSALNFLTFRPLFLPRSGARAALTFVPEPTVVKAQFTLVLYIYRLEVEGVGKRGYAARSPIDGMTRSEARSALRALGQVATDGES